MSYYQSEISRSSCKTVQFVRTPKAGVVVLLTLTQQIAQHALTILVNLAADGEILKNLATDDKFLRVIFSRIIVGEPRVAKTPSNGCGLRHAAR